MTARSTTPALAISLAAAAATLSFLGRQSPESSPSSPPRLAVIAHDRGPEQLQHK
jgi:hypothetical protein